MIAINKTLLPGCTGEGCSGETGTCTDSPIHRGNAENRAPTTRSHRRAVALNRWLTRGPIGYRGGINLYGYVNSSPVGNVDAGGLVDWGGTTSKDPNAAETGPIPGAWKWKRFNGSTWEGERGVVQNLGTVVTNGMNPSEYHLLKIIMEIMKSIPVGASILDSVNHQLGITDFSDVRWRYRITAAGPNISRCASLAPLGR